MNKKILSLILAGVISVSMLVGCKNEGNDSQTENTTTADTQMTALHTTVPTSDEDGSGGATAETTVVTTGQATQTADSTTAKTDATTAKVTTTAKTTTTTKKDDTIPVPVNEAKLKPDGEKPSKTSIGNKSTAQIVRNMGIGINLGNTFEATKSGGKTVKDFETAWGSPVITKAMIEGIAKEGFGVLRVPVAWSNMMDSNYNIDTAYINRVKQIIDWAIDSGMYVIVNIHWDGGWWENFPTQKAECMKKYTAIWTQLSSAFINYGDGLMLESLNEEGGWDSLWNKYSGTETEGKKQSYALLNEINQKFVDIVRGSGGNNAKRHLLIAGYNTDLELTLDPLFKMPNDSAKRMALSIHYYHPTAFTIIDKDVDWAKAIKTWGSANNYKVLETNMNKMKDNFVNKGIPVIIGECGVANTGFSNKTTEVIRNYNLAVARSAYYKGICPVIWDTPNGYYDRNNGKLKDAEFKKGILNILK